MRNANPTFQFSPHEKGELVKAWVLTSLAFAIFFLRTGFLPLKNITFVGFALVFCIAAVTAGLGFVLHEMCHKYAAHHFGVHGEFHSNGFMLIASIFLAFMGFLFAAPGAVMIFGNITKRENGIISLAGPLCNVVLALLFLPLTFLGGFLETVGSIGLLVNAILGAFNMIPFLGLDGEKIFVWNKLVYFSLVIVAGMLVVLSYML